MDMRQVQAKGANIFRETIKALTHNTHTAGTNTDNNTTAHISRTRKDGTHITK